MTMISPKSKMTVLVVDDDPEFVAQHQSMLEALGFQVFTAESQLQAEEMLKTLQPDLAIVDLVLEHMDGGFALCYHIKKRNPRTPVILVSAVSSETGIEIDATTDEERSWIKADLLLAKPMRFEQLQREIERLMKV